MINGITSTQEMKRLKAKNIHRQTLQEGTSIVSNYGPIRVHDARMRIAKDDYHRRAAQAEEERRFRKKEGIDEVKYIHRWMREVRIIIRASLNESRGDAARKGWWAKSSRQKLLSSNEDMSKRYALIREFQEAAGVTEGRHSGITWPPDYGKETITSAVKFLALEERERRTAREVLTLEAAGLEITVEDYIEVSQCVFMVPKEEED